MLVLSLVVPVLLLPLLWTGLTGFVDGRRGTLGFYPLGATVPACALAYAVFCRARAGKGARSRAGTVLAVLSCLLYSAPVVLYGYVVWEAWWR